LPPVIKGGAFVENSQGHWYVALHVEVADAQSTGSGSIGIDLGLKHFATLSNGEKIESPRAYRLWEQKLATAQRAGNRRRVKAIHAKISNIRKDHHHKATTRLARAYGLIAVGNVSSSKLAKTRMAKSVLDAGWSAFRNQLRYKASRHGVEYKEVDERFTSQRCSRCGEVPRSSPKGMGALGIREWVCSSCGASHDRDVNAARNILALGLSAQPPVEGSRMAFGWISTEAGR
jgi:putative transposase